MKMGALEYTLHPSNGSFILLLYLLFLAAAGYIDAASPFADEISNGRSENDKGNHSYRNDVADE